MQKKPRMGSAMLTLWSNAGCLAGVGGVQADVDVVAAGAVRVVDGDPEVGALPVVGVSQHLVAAAELGGVGAVDGDQAEGAGLPLVDARRQPGGSIWSWMVMRASPWRRPPRVSWSGVLAQ